LVVIDDTASRCDSRSARTPIEALEVLLKGVLNLGAAHVATEAYALCIATFLAGVLDERLGKLDHERRSYNKFVHFNLIVKLNTYNDGFPTKWIPITRFSEPGQRPYLPIEEAASRSAC